MGLGFLPVACVFEGCDRPARARGFCAGHYQQLNAGRTLVPLNSTRRPNGTPPRIEFDLVPCPKPELGDCHIFRGYKEKGYGRVGLPGGKLIRVHRYVWEQVNGPVPDGLEVDHVCQVKACCNLAHLRAVTHKTNCRENSVGPPAVNAVKTHCIHGHEFTPENTYHDGRRRACRECVRQAQRAYQRRKLATMIL